MAFFQFSGCVRYFTAYERNFFADAVICSSDVYAIPNVILDGGSRGSLTRWSLQYCAASSLQMHTPSPIRTIARDAGVSYVVCLT